MGTAIDEQQPQPSAFVIARAIDHTLLKPDATEADIRCVCQEALQYRFRGVCVRVGWLGLVADLLKGSEHTVPVAVVGFHEGTDRLLKVRETLEALMLGAVEVDMVLRRDLLVAGDYRGVLEDIRAVVSVAGRMRVKVILESHLLTPEQIVTACEIVVEARAHFVKTSTGFTGGGATVEAVRLMRKTVGPNFGVKASGGIRTVDDARAMLAAGANVLGCSAGVQIVTSGAPAMASAY